METTFNGGNYELIERRRIILKTRPRIRYYTLTASFNAGNLEKMIWFNFIEGATYTITMTIPSTTVVSYIRCGIRGSTVASTNNVYNTHSITTPTFIYPSGNTWKQINAYIREANEACTATFLIVETV